MNKIFFSKHSLKKIKILNEHGFKINKKAVVDIMQNPDKIINGYKERKIAQKITGRKYIIRVIFIEYSDSKKIITIYPQKGSDMKIRYSKKEDILIIELSNEKINYAEEKGPIIIHFSFDKKPVFLEILEASEFLSGAMKLKSSTKGRKPSEIII